MRVFNEMRHWMAIWIGTLAGTRVDDIQKYFSVKNLKTEGGYMENTTDD